MRLTFQVICSILTFSLALMLATASGFAAACADGANSLGVSRIVEIDVSGGPLFGAITKRKTEESFLKPKEVVLTFDDGPAPSITNPILDTLDKFCTKATFFAVGEMAVSYPDTVKRILARGHTLGAHTWSHPLHLDRMRLQRAVDQIEKGFSAVAMAAGEPIAPFFRFPGLNDSRKMLNYLQKRGLGSFTVDVVSDDSFISDPDRLATVTLRRVEQNQGGILLFHDIKRSTAKALPRILRVLKRRGYRIVHLIPKKKYKRLAKHDAKLAAILSRVQRRNASARQQRQSTLQTASRAPILLPFYGTLGPGKYAKMRYLGPPVTQLAPAPRQRLKKKIAQNKRSKTGSRSQMPKPVQAAAPQPPSATQSAPGAEPAAGPLNGPPQPALELPDQ